MTYRDSPDLEFMEQLEILLHETSSLILSAEVIKDSKKARYLRGIFRGLEMTKEAYYTCWQITEIEQNPPNVLTSTTKAPKSPPTGSQTGDQE